MKIWYEIYSHISNIYLEETSKNSIHVSLYITMFAPLLMKFYFLDYEWKLITFTLSDTS